MSRFFVPIKNQNGSMILIAMMLLVTLTVMGISSTNTSIIENRIAVNEQVHTMAFYYADSGIYSTAKIVGWAIDESDPISDENFEFIYLVDEENFWEQITLPIDEYDGGVADISYALGDGVVRADIMRIGTSSSGQPEGGAVFGEGATSPIGGQEISIYFRILSEGTSLRNSVSIISAGYQKVLGVTGGL